MSVGSPTAYLLWAILASVFWGFIIYHLWCYDKFQCLRWNSGRQPGAFKRIMTYSYLISVPLFLVFGVAMTVLKFKEGFTVKPDGTIIPKLHRDWRDDHRRWILPLYFVFCGGWAFELVTHLEELLFWVFLFNQGPGKREWFGSSECRAWYIGSLTALLGMPLVALVSRTDLDQSEAWIFLVGSSAGTATTILFLYVLARFPRFLRHVKHEGATPDVVVRLTTFYHLNRARVCFRFLFTVPLFVLAIDSIVGKRDIVFDPFWSDFLLMISGLGCFSSSAITLLIFFPRSNVEAPNPVAGHISPPMSPHQEYIHHKHSLGYQPPSPRSPKAYAMPVDTTMYRPSSIELTPEYSTLDYDVQNVNRTSLPVPAVRNARETVWATQEPTQDTGAFFYSDEPHHVHPRHHKSLADLRQPSAPYDVERLGLSTLHPYVTSFTSPIDLPDDDGPYAI